jgi:hypothetical protein
MKKSTELPLAVRNLQKLWRSKQLEMKFTQVQAAKTLAWTQGAISHYLNDVTELNPQAVIKFANFLDVDPLEIDPNITPFLPNLTQIKIECDSKNVTNKIKSTVYIKDQSGLMNVMVSPDVTLENNDLLLQTSKTNLKCIVQLADVKDYPQAKMFAAQLKTEKHLRFYLTADRPDSGIVKNLWAVVSFMYI